MKIRSGNVIPWLAALLCLTLAHAGRAADNSEAPMVSNSQATGAQPKLAEQDIWKRWKLAHDPQAANAEARLSPGAPTPANKASGLLGMEVRNQKGERLGHVKDLVIDWKTEQVSYAVISAVSKAAPGIDKLLAVPLAALALSGDQKHVVLDADKSKVQAARGFDRDDWPSVSNPSWGAEPFWQHDAGRQAAPDQPAK